jgi:predicted acyltransferase
VQRRNAFFTSPAVKRSFRRCYAAGWSQRDNHYRALRNHTTPTRIEPDPMSDTAVKAPASTRLMSLDALRGFDMFWIIGADSLVYALNRMTQNPATKFLAEQLDHADWAGFRFYDLIFPLFIFMVGASIVFSLTKIINESGRVGAIHRVLKRGLLLFIIGLIYSGGFTNPWPDLRLMGVLNRIALAYTAAGLLFCLFKPRTLVGICAGILVGYWALLTFVPIRDIQLEKTNLAALAQQAGDSQLAGQFRQAGNAATINPSAIKNSPVWAATEEVFAATTNRVTGKYDMGYNLANHLDFQYLPGKKWDLFWDPEGILSTLPAIATCLLGIFAGLVLMNSAFGNDRKLLWLFGAGSACVALGWLWGLQFPVIKKIWTSSYVLVAGGYSAILLGAFYLVVDVWKYQKWCQPFVWMGMNAITIYLVKNFLGGTFNRLSARLVGGDVKLWLDEHIAIGFGDLMVAVVGLLIAFWLVRFLYQRKIFLRV